jgi:FkbM family methyltransferase
MKEISITDKQAWKSFIISEANYKIPEECKGGLCIDAGCNIGDFVINQGTRFDKYVCFDVFQENVDECIKNTKHIGLDVDVKKLAVWSNDNSNIEVMAYKDINNTFDHFGNSGNVGCIEMIGTQGEGWMKENTIDIVKSISIESIIKQYGKINLLKIDVEGSEYEFLLGKDLSDINYIVGEIHFESEKQQQLIDWIQKTHQRLDTFTFKKLPNN